MKALKTVFENKSFQLYFRNSSWMLAEQILRIISGVLVGIYVARYLGPEQFGVLSYALAISAFVLAITRLGMDAILVRELVGKPSDQTALIGTAFWLMSLAAVACYGIAGLGVYYLEGSADIRLYVLIVTASAFFTSFLVVDYYFQAELKSKYSAICKFCALLFMSLFKLGLIFAEAEFVWFVVAALLDNVLVALLFLSLFAKLRGLHFLGSFSWRAAGVLLKSAWPMVLTAVAALIYMRIDQVMIRNMLGLHEVGIYSAAAKIYESWIVLPYIISVSLLPAIVKLKQGSAEDYQRRLAQLFRLVIWMSVLVAIVVSIISEPLMVIAFGEAYRESASVVSIVMWTSIFASMGAISARYFNVERMEKKIALRTAVAALMNVGLNFILIPRYGINGAAIATLLCVFFANYMMDWFDKDLRDLLTIKHRALFGHPFK